MVGIVFGEVVHLRIVDQIVYRTLYSQGGEMVKFLGPQSKPGAAEKVELQVPSVSRCAMCVSRCVDWPNLSMIDSGCARPVSQVQESGCVFSASVTLIPARFLRYGIQPGKM